MVIEYWITGGVIVMEKGAFTAEILRKDSIVRSFIDSSSSIGSEPQNNAVKKNEDGTVTIDLRRWEEKKLEQDPNALADELKKRYGDKIKGRISFKYLYTTFGQLFYETAELE